MTDSPSYPDIGGPYVLTIPCQTDAQKIADQACGSCGQGDLMRELSKHPLAIVERDVSKPWLRMDHIHLSRFDGTDYCQWWGRCADGFHRPVGRILQIIPIKVPA